jgi:hypothetical protein
LNETHQRYFHLASRAGEPVVEGEFRWLKNHLGNALSLVSSNRTILGAVEVFVDIQFVKHPAFALVSVWAALESLFGIDQEIKYRLAAYIATYLEPHGPTRKELYNKCTALYGRRCKAAHAGLKPEANDLLESIVVLRRVLLKIIESNASPKAKDIEQLLFDDAALNC